MTIDVTLKNDRGAIMRALAETAENAEYGDGLRMKMGSGIVTVAPLTLQCALRIVAESEDMEAAQELCDVLRRKVQKLDNMAKGSG